MQVDIRVLELLSSKLCHDLISPVSAINNGVELIEDIGGSVVDEAMKLIGDSAGQAARRLKLFRMAYGRAGSEDGLAARDARQVIDQYLQGGKVNLNWPDTMFADWPDVAKGYFKVLLNFVVLAEEVLAYGGALRLLPSENQQRVGCIIEVEGRGAQLSPQIRSALDGVAAVEELTPRSIQAYITGRFATHFGLEVECQQFGQDCLRISLYAPAAVTLLVKNY